MTHLSSLPYPMIIHTPLLGSILPIKNIWLLDDGQQICLKQTQTMGTCIKLSLQVD